MNNQTPCQKELSHLVFPYAWMLQNTHLIGTEKYTKAMSEVIEGLVEAEKKFNLLEIAYTLHEFGGKQIGNLLFEELCRRHFEKGGQNG